MVSYAAAAAAKQSVGSSRSTVPADEKASTSSSAAAAAAAQQQQQGPVLVKVTALLTRNGPPPQIGRTKNNNSVAKTSPSPSTSSPTVDGDPSSPVTKNTAKGKGGGTPNKNSGKQQQPKKKNGSLTKTLVGSADKKEGAGPSPPVPFKKPKPNSPKKEITLGDLIKKQQPPSQQQQQHKKQQPFKKNHNKQHQSSTALPPPHRTADPAVTLTLDNFPALLSSSSNPSSTLPAAGGGGTQGKQKSGHDAVTISKVKHVVAGTNNDNSINCKAAAVPTSVTKHQPSLAENHQTKCKKAKTTTGSPNEKKSPKKVAAGAAAAGASSKSKSSQGMAASSILGPKPCADRRRENEGGGGQEHDLMRLLEKRQIVLGGGGQESKGRQRIRPRKKKFTALKKKVLEERLIKWRQLHPPVVVDHATKEEEENNNNNNNSKTSPSAKVETGASSVNNSWSTTVCIHGFAEVELLEDDDEYEELIANLQEMARKIGQCKRTFIPRRRGDDDAIIIITTTGDIPSSSSSCPAFVEFANPSDAGAAVSCWDGLALGGSPIKAQHVLIKNDDASLLTDEDWQQQCLVVMAKSSMVDKSNDDADDPQSKEQSETTAKVILENVLTEDDMEDEGCLMESLNDCRTLVEQFGLVKELLVERESMQLIVVYHGGLVVARQAAKALGQTVVAGVKVSATVMLGDAEIVDLHQSTTCNNDRVILLHGALTEDDLEDEECLEESLNDIRELALQFGPVEAIAVEGAAIVRIQFSFPSENVVKTAVAGFNGMVIGGLSIRASLPEGFESIEETIMESTSIAPTPVAEDKQEPSPMFSGDKRIPERFAECKRVPKIPNASGGVPRHYAVLTGDDSVKPLLIEMLGELMRLQKRAVDDKNAKARRRLVMGLREVARGIRSHKTKMVVMANNLDEYGIIDDKLQQILDLCREEGVPVFFEFNKRSLGHAIGKSIKIAVIGIQNAEGAHQQFKKLVRLAPALPLPSPLVTDVNSPS